MKTNYIYFLQLVARIDAQCFIILFYVLPVCNGNNEIIQQNWNRQGVLEFLLPIAFNILAYCCAKLEIW